MITCSHCGQIAADGSAFCPNCGAALPAPYFQQPQQPVQQPVYPQPQMPPYPGYPTPCEQPGTNGKAVASLVMGICSLLVWLLFLTNDFDAFSFLSIPLGIISIVMGAVAKKEIRRTTPGGSTALATAGIVCSIISLALDVVFFVLGLIFVVILGMLWQDFKHPVHIPIRNRSCDLFP